MSAMDRRTLALTLGLSLIAGDAVAIVGGTAPDATDYRFDAIAAFATVWRLGLDPSHPGAADHDWYCTATLINPNQVLIAEHCVTAYPDQSNYAVRFRRHLDGSLGTKAAGPASYHHERIASWVFPADGSDVALGTLVAPVVHVEPIPVIVAETTTLWQLGSPFIHAGWGREGPLSGDGEQNQLLLCNNWPTVLTVEQINFFNAWHPDGPLCGVNNHDSGSPVLLEATDGELRVAGVVGSTTSATHVARFVGDPSFALTTEPFSAADLTLQTPILTAIEQLLLPGASVELDLVATNLGAAAATAFDVSVLLSTDVQVDDGDVELVSPVTVPSLAAGATSPAGGTFTVPAATPAGAFSVAVLADRTEQAAESLPTNNRWQSAEPLLFVHPNPVEHEGIYIGWLTDKLSGATRGRFGLYRRSNDTAVLLTYDSQTEQAYQAEGPISSSGVLTLDDGGANISVDLSTEPIVGEIGDQVDLSAELQPPFGEVAHLVGYYTGDLEGAHVGEAHAVVGPGGEAVIVAIADDVAWGQGFTQPWAEIDTGFETPYGLVGRFGWDEPQQVNLLIGALLDNRGLIASLTLARESTPPAPADIGEPCDQDWACTQGNGGGEAICLIAEPWPDGYCVVPDCAEGSCPDGAVCTPIDTPLPSAALCLRSCDADAEQPCRDGYACVAAAGAPSGSCQPRCSTDDDCERPLSCNDQSGLCEPSPPTSTEPPPPSDSESSSCDCRVPQQRPLRGAWLLALLALPLGLRRAARRSPLARHRMRLDG